jgi:hypothetical protein
MVIFVVIFLFVTIAWLSYWVMVRPVVLDSVVDEMRRMRSSLEWAMIEDAPGSRTEAAQKLLKYLEYGPCVRFLSFGPAAAIRFFNRSEIRAFSVKEREVFEPAPLWIREMWQRHARIGVKAVLANSPIWWIPLSLILLAGLFSRKAEIWWTETEAATSKLMPGSILLVPQAS